MYMKKNFFYAAALAMGLTFSMTACSNGADLFDDSVQ